MATTWRILISMRTDANTAAPTDVADVLRAEVDEIRHALQDRANASVRLERLVSPFAQPTPPDPSEPVDQSADTGSEWLITIEAQTYSDHVIEQYFVLHSVERLQKKLGDDIFVDLTRSSGGTTRYVGAIAGGFRIVVSVNPSAQIGALQRIESDVRSVAGELRNAIEIRGLGWVRIVWHSLVPDLDTQGGIDPRGERPTTPCTFAEIVIEQDAEQLSESEPFADFVAGLCHAVAVPWTDSAETPVAVSVLRFTLEPPDPRPQFHFRGLARPWLDDGKV